MVPTYTSKGDRRYRYYVCRVAQEKGRSACLTKSVAARALEESVVVQVRAALTTEDTRKHLEISETDWRAFGENEFGDVVRRVVQRVEYDGTSGAVSLELGK